MKARTQDPMDLQRDRQASDATWPESWPDRQSQAQPQSDPLTEIRARLTALENRPTLSTSDVKSAVEDHPLIADFRAFMQRWQQQP
jgi:hypothetical protein